MLPDIYSGSTTLVVGAIALVVYWLGKLSEKKSAAAIIVMDIRHAEQVVTSILEKTSVDIITKNILHENNWAKYKHFFASELSYDDFVAFNRFFDSCEEISSARVLIRDIFNKNLTEKAAILQQFLFKIDDPTSPEGKAKRQEIIDNVNNESYVFEPSEQRQRVFLCFN